MASKDLRPWECLPTDILTEIIRRLYLHDQLSFHLTCKSWKLAQCDQPASKLLWLFFHNWNWDNNGNILSICKYHDPFTNQTFTNTCKIDDEDVYGASICASKYGWLLMQRSKFVFVYHPYSKKIFKLPDLNITFNRSTFSANPNSPDCLFFALESSKSIPDLRISICKIGDPKWETYSFDGISRAIEDVVYSNGEFYCVFTGGVLGKFTVELNEWKLLTDMAPLVRISIRCRVRLVESNGEILLVCFSSRAHVFRFDFPSMSWAEKGQLGNHAVFLGCTSMFVLAENETSDLAGKIYDQENLARFYTLTNERENIHVRTEDRVWIDPPRV